MSSLSLVFETQVFRQALGVTKQTAGLSKVIWSPRTFFESYNFPRCFRQPTSTCCYVSVFAGTCPTMPAPPKEDVRSVAKGPVGKLCQPWNGQNVHWDHWLITIVGHLRKACCVQSECHDHKLQMLHLQRLESTTFGLFTTREYQFTTPASPGIRDRFFQKHLPGDTLQRHRCRNEGPDSLPAKIYWVALCNRSMGKLAIPLRQS